MSGRVLVIGSSGQLASSLKEIADENYLFAGRALLDVRDKEAVKKTADNFKPDLIINASGYTAVDKAETEIDEAYALNSEAVKNLALLCAELGVPLIHISTDYVFDGNSKIPYKETDIPNPLNIYGKSKLAGEEHMRKILKKHIIIRSSWICSQYGTNFVKTMLNLSGKEEVKIIDDQFGRPTFASNLAEAVKLVAGKIMSFPKEAVYGTYHYADSPQTSWYGFAKAIFEYLAEKYKIKIPKVTAISTEEYNSPTKRALYSVLDSSSIEKNFGVKPKSWEESLHLCLDRIRI